MIQVTINDIHWLESVKTYLRSITEALVSVDDKRFLVLFFLSLQFLLTCCVNFRVTSNAVTINEKTFGTLRLILYFQLKNSVKASPLQKPNQASIALRCLLFFMIPILNFKLFET